MKKKRFLLLIALCILTAFGFKANAQEAMAKIKKSYPVAMQEYGKKMSELKTDYIIAIDVSATMGKYKEEVVPALTRFFDSIGDGNFVRIISFGTIAKEEQTRLEISKQTRPQIVEKLNYVYDKVMNDKGMRGYTDFVLLGNKVVDLIESDNDSDIHFVVVFSDIMDDPNPQVKAKGTKHRADKEWNDLQHRFKTLEVPVNTLSTYFSHEAKDEKQILESIELVKKAFPNFEYSNDINEVLGNMLEGSKFVIYTDKLKQLIVNDVNEIGKKELFGSQIEKDKSLTLSVDMDKEVLGVKKYIRGIVIDTCILGEKSNDVLDIEFNNHYEIAKRNGIKSIGKVEFDKGGLWTKNCFAEFVMQYHFLYQQGKDEKAQSFTKDMEALGLLDQLPQKASFHADGPFVFLWPFWLICVVAAAIIIYIILLVVNTIIPHTAKNKKLVVKDPLTNNMQYYQLTGKRTFTIGNQNCNCIIPGALFVIKATCRNGSPLNILWKRRVVLALDPQNKTGVQMAQGSRNNLMKASIRKGKEVTVTQNIVTRFVITLS